MLRAQNKQAKHSATGLRFGIAAAAYNTELADALLENCVATLQAAGSRDLRIIRVPGSFEICAAATWLARTGKCDCVIGLGILLQGETSHAQHIADAVAHGLTNITIRTGVPTVFGLVTANNLRQAQTRCLGKQHNRGREAATTAIQMARLWKNL